LRLAARIDENQPEIVLALRKMGAGVTTLHSVGHGVSDILVSWRQRWFVMEIKNPTKPKADQELTKDQKVWIAEQKAPVYIVTSPLEAVTFMQMVKP